MAAQTLIEGGATVLMLDGGATDTKYAGKIPDADYLTIKRQETNQYEYFIGKDFEGIPFGHIKTGEHLTPPRKFMLQHVKEWMPLVSGNFFPLESLALGGLGNGWGVGCCIFSDAELRAAGLNPAEMRPAYEVVGKRIGISGTRDDAEKYTAASLPELMPSIKMDSTGKNLLENYERKKKHLNDKGFYMGRPSLALLTENRDGRRAYQYKDLDFYCDQDKSAYRPSFTINELKNNSRFIYKGGVIVLSFQEKENSITVECRSLENNEPIAFQCRKLVLAASCLSTARIILRSKQAFDIPLPIISNPYTYLPTIQPYLLGKDIDDRKVGFAQLSLFYDPNGTNMDVVMGSLYSYRSLMAFHILKETPMGIKTGYRFLQYMMPAFAIMGLFQPERGGEHKRLALRKDASRLTGDVLHVNYQLSDAEARQVCLNERKFASALRSLNCFVIKEVNPGQGSGIHYAGTLPFSNKNEAFHLLQNGQLGETKNVFVADGSGFNYLPAKGLTFSIMANAHRVAKHALIG